MMETDSAAVRFSSDVWKWYKKLSDKTKVECTLCEKKIAYRGGTTNLRNHLMSKHPLTYKPKTKKGEGSSMGSVLKMQTTLDTAVKPRCCSESRAKEISERILLMIVLDLRPVRAVEGHGFKDLMHYLKPGYTVPSRKHFTKLLRHKHSLSKEKLCSKFEETDSIALTTDIWTSAATEAYITVTAHYIEIATKLKQICETLELVTKYLNLFMIELLT